MLVRYWCEDYQTHYSGDGGLFWDRGLVHLECWRHICYGTAGTNAIGTAKLDDWTRCLKNAVALFSSTPIGVHSYIAFSAEPSRFDNNRTFGFTIERTISISISVICNCVKHIYVLIKHQIGVYFYTLQFTQSCASWSIEIQFITQRYMYAILAFLDRHLSFYIGSQPLFSPPLSSF